MRTWCMMPGVAWAAAYVLLTQVVEQAESLKLRLVRVLPGAVAAQQPAEALLQVRVVYPRVVEPQRLFAEPVRGVEQEAYDPLQHGRALGPRHPLDDHVLTDAAQPVEHEVIHLQCRRGAGLQSDDTEQHHTQGPTYFVLPGMHSVPGCGRIIPLANNFLLSYFLFVT